MLATYGQFVRHSFFLSMKFTQELGDFCSQKLVFWWPFLLFCPAFKIDKGMLIVSAICIVCVLWRKWSYNVSAFSAVWTLQKWPVLSMLCSFIHLQRLSQGFEKNSTISSIIPFIWISVSEAPLTMILLFSELTSTLCLADCITKLLLSSWILLLMPAIVYIFNKPEFVDCSASHCYGWLEV